MAKNFEPDQQDILDAIGDMSFLPPAAKDPNLGRPFPQIKKGENIFRFIYAVLMTLSVATFLILLFIYAPTSHHFSTSSTGNFGVFGIIIFALCALVFLVGHVYGYRFDTKYSDNKDRYDFNKALGATFYYVALGLLYVMISLTCLRYEIVSKLLSDNWFMQSTGIIALVCILLVCVGGIIINFVAPKKAKFYNWFVLAVALWVVVWFASVLSRRSSLSSNYGILFFILGAISGDLALPFLIAEKKTGCRSIYQVILSFTFFFETTALLDYAMVSLN